MRTMEQKAADLASKIDRQIKKGANKGLDTARLFGLARVVEEASVRAPTRTSKSGRKYATERATPGAALRVVSGRFRESLTSEMVSPFEAIIGSNAHADARSRAIIVSFHGVVQQGGFSYPAYHEIPGWGGYQGAGKHQTFQPVFAKYMDAMGTIIGSAVKVELA